ncbi:hypothetical protein SS1G_05772 [Sclerotinia sclerotiorum 1980 UF-70]|uniref:Cytochrome P450 n=1 Tax=Sclerotinia sclerotiorum (strain ATCC 18683 / 1980 / Ss-1) TaxID=665079 RepID=A7EKC5_SCLS1|nr:hypothetical protein SS1G_05772 [Sclerotinia sclerotiorum 1980 UF-70]EDO03291.1 hypothetical protein SS1G_05772 [Sclerotinia sclerotiorum 1980 UF-70]
MTTSLFTLFLSSIVLSSIYWFWTKALAWSSRKKAGCSSPVKYKHLDPFFGFDLLSKKIQYTKAGNLLALDDELFAKYGKTLHTIFFGRNHWMTMDHLVIQTVAATEADKFGSAPSNRKPAWPLLGDGAFTTDGHIWKRSRELLQPVFSRSQVSQLSGLKSHMERFFERIPRDGSTIDIQPLAQGLFLDSSMEFIFGKSSGTLSPSEETVEAKQFSQDFDEGLRGMRKNYMTDKISWLVGPDKKWLAQCAKIHATLEGYIDDEIEIQRQSKLLGQPTETTDEPSAYKHILLKELVKKYPGNKTLIRNELMNVFFAARDSVGTVTSSMLFLLARSPESWEKLRKEVAAIPLKQELTFEFLKSLKYVQAVIDERLYKSLRRLEIGMIALNMWKNTIDTRFTNASSTPYQVDPAAAKSKRDDSKPGEGDISDAQYYNFRTNVPYLAILVVFHPILRRIYEYLKPISTRVGSPKLNGNNTYISVAEGNARLEQRVRFDFIFAFIYLLALHGFSAFKVIIIVYTNYCLATRLPRKFVPVATWVFNIGILFANELSDGYRFTSVAQYVLPKNEAGFRNGTSLHSWAEWMDSYSGIIPRWEILFNLTVLRLISFNLDYYWSQEKGAGSALEKKQLDPANLSERDRVSIPASDKDYNYRNYFAYAIYAPLYLAGPIFTFNDYIIIAGMLFPRKKWLNNLTYYRVLCGIGAVANLMFMMIANLVGFAVGVDGLKSIISGIFKDFSGIVFLITAWGALFVGCQIMFEVRESEHRKGIYLRC